MSLFYNLLYYKAGFFQVCKLDILGKAATAFNRLLGIKYEIILGKKGKTTVFSISFEKHEFYHIAGLQYLTDIRELKTDRAILFERIIKDRCI